MLNFYGKRHIFCLDTSSFGAQATAMRGNVMINMTNEKRKQDEYSKQIMNAMASRVDERRSFTIPKGLSDQELLQLMRERKKVAFECKA
ncbi:hypothetical protein BOO31_18680 [Vibrio navarrensis]|nr:hypothetical protein [Vibrio navarrensis]